MDFAFRFWGFVGRSWAAAGRRITGVGVGSLVAHPTFRTMSGARPAALSRRASERRPASVRQIECTTVADPDLDADSMARTFACVTSWAMEMYLVVMHRS